MECDRREILVEKANIYVVLSENKEVDAFEKKYSDDFYYNCISRFLLQASPCYMRDSRDSFKNTVFRTHLIPNG